MTKNIDIKVNTVHAVWGALAWKAPTLICLFVAILGVGSLIPYVISNHNKQVSKMAKFRELVSRCERTQYEESGRYDSLACKKWANTYYRVYDF